MNKGGIESVCITAIFEYCVSLVVAECGGVIWGDLRHPKNSHYPPKYAAHATKKVSARKHPNTPGSRGFAVYLP